MHQVLSVLGRRWWAWAWPRRVRTVFRVYEPSSNKPESLIAGQAVVGLGVVAAGAYGVHALLTPRVSQWYRTWRYGEAPRADAAAQERQVAELVAAALKEQARSDNSCT